MRLNKIEKDLNIKDLKLNFSKFWTKVKIFVGGSFLVANIAACSPAVEDVDATTYAPTTTTESVVPSSSEEVTPSTEVEPSTSEVTPSTSETDPVEVQPTEVVDDGYVETNEVIALIEDITAKYPNIDKNQLVAAIVVCNLDHITAESYDEIMDAYTLSNEELNNQFIAFVEFYCAGIYDTARYYMADPNANVKSYEELPKFVEFAMTDEDREVAANYDENAFAANATTRFGEFIVGNVNTYKNFDNISSFETACKRLQYYIVKAKHPEQFNSFEVQFTK